MVSTRNMTTYGIKPKLIYIDLDWENISLSKFKRILNRNPNIRVNTIMLTTNERADLLTAYAKLGYDLAPEICQFINSIECAKAYLDIKGATPDNVMQLAWCIYSHYGDLDLALEVMCINPDSISYLCNFKIHNILDGDIDSLQYIVSNVSNHRYLNHFVELAKNNNRINILNMINLDYNVKFVDNVLDINILNKIPLQDLRTSYNCPTEFTRLEHWINVVISSKTSIEEDTIVKTMVYLLNNLNIPPCDYKCYVLAILLLFDQYFSLPNAIHYLAYKYDLNQISKALKNTKLLLNDI